MEFDDEYFIREALKEAKKAFEEGEVPIGAVLVKEKKIIGRAHNQVEKLKDATAHAEMIAITQASSHLENWRLDKCILYVTVEPCPMCAGAILLSRISKLTYCIDDKKFGACGSVFDILNSSKKLSIVKGILENESASLMKDFFKRLRQKSN